MNQGSIRTLSFLSLPLWDDRTKNLWFPTARPKVACAASLGYPDFGGSGQVRSDPQQPAESADLMDVKWSSIANK
jgi:hypothetical protein